MIPHNRPSLGTEEEGAAIRVIQSGWLAQGNEVKAFEDELCRFLGLADGHAVAVSSGTAALYLSLWALGASGKRVALPSYVCAALRNAVAMARATECLIDNATESPNMDLKVIEHSGADLAIVPHTFGIPAAVAKLAATLPVIEDCAQSLGASMDGVPTGLTGRLGVFSFYATKLMTTGGQGGAVVSKDKALIDTIRDYREFDCRKDSKLRFNFQMTDLQAAIGGAQLLKLPAFLKRRSEIYEFYKNSGLGLIDGTGNIQPVRYRAVLRTESPRTVIEQLAARGIKAIVPLEDWELLGERSRFPNAHALTQCTVSLPAYPSLTDEELGSVVAGVLNR